MVWTPQITADGSFTFFSEEFGETFHSDQGARTEAFDKFAAATLLAEKARGTRVCLLDVCYGLGYNTAAALETIWAINPACRVEVYGLELDGTVPLGAIAPELLAGWTQPVQGILRGLAQTQGVETTRVSAKLLLGDARQTIQRLRDQGFVADGIFFDPFSPRRCPQLWTVDFLTQVAGCLAPTGRLSTYSRSASVRRALLEVGLAIGSIPMGNAASGPDPKLRSHEWSQGTIAAWLAEGLPLLSPLEQEHLQTRAAVPYRDPSLRDTAEAIAARQRQEQESCGLESTSSWRRRWGIH